MTRFAPTLVLSLMLCACESGQKIDPQQQTGPNPMLPDPSPGLIPGMNVADPVGWKAGETPKVPAGFAIQKLADGLTSPRNVYPLANGDILVVQSVNEQKEPVDRPKNPIFDFVMSLSHGGGGQEGPTNQVTLLRDSNGDGKAELQSVLIDHLNSPFGIVLVGGDLYVACTDAIMRYPFTPGQTKLDGPGQKVVDLPAGPINHHWTKSLTASPDGSKLYVGVGSNSNVGERGVEAETNRAAIWEVDTETGAFRVFAAGLRNPNGLTFYPGSNTLWAVINERDELGPNLVPDYMTSVRPGAFYGWPYSYWGQHVDARVRPQRPDLVRRAIMPDYSLSSHVAPLGLAFSSSATFPTRFRGGAFVAEHGSWNREQRNGYKIVYIPFRNARPSGKPETFVSGFIGSDEKVHGRPVGIAFDRTGALIIADDAGGAVWRVSYNVPAPVKVSGAQMISF